MNTKTSTKTATKKVSANASNNAKAENPQSNIISNFDFEGLLRRKARAAAGSADLVAALAKLSPDIQNLKVGDCAKIVIPATVDGKPITERQFIMSITAKLNNLTAKGREWAGKKFRSGSEDGVLYVFRDDDGEPVERKKGPGRPKKVVQAQATTTPETKPTTNENENNEEVARIVHA